jgi:GNAT superfamily N-acetyltransferase
MMRVADLSDAPGIESLMKSISGFWDAAWPSNVVERAIGSAEAVAVVHLTGTEIDGFACAHDLGFRGYLSEIVVAASAQRRGIGGRLLLEIERLLSERGCTTVMADVWRDAEKFYRSHGWTPPAVVLLRKRLSE